MLDPTLASQLQTHLQKITRPIALAASLDDSPKSAELLDLLTEIAGMSDRITVERRDDDARRPSFAIERVGTDVAVRFAGVPFGHEFTSLVLALLQVGGHPSTASEELVRQIQELDEELHFETYFSLTCQNCPDVVQALNLISILNPRITHVAIDGALFQDEVDERQVMAVPTVFVSGEGHDDGEAWGAGRMTLEEIVAKLDSGAADRQVEELRNKDTFDVLVVGGGPAGAASAIYAARKGISTGVVAERFGGQVLDTMSIENFISVPYTEGPKLAAALEQHVKDYDADIMNLQRGHPTGPVGAATASRSQVELASGATLSGPHGRALHRRPLARHERAGRGRVPQPRRHLLPPLRRPALQGQAGRRDRGRQLRRRGGDRPGRRGRPRDADRVRRPAPRG